LFWGIIYALLAILAIYFAKQNFDKAWAALTYERDAEYQDEADLQETRYYVFAGLWLVQTYCAASFGLDAYRALF
jgi:hypothetical protein